MARWTFLALNGSLIQGSMPKMFPDLHHELCCSNEKNYPAEYTSQSVRAMVYLYVKRI